MLNIISHEVNANKVYYKSYITIMIAFWKTLITLSFPEELQNITSVGMGMGKSETLSMVGGKLKWCNCNGTV